MDQSPEPDDRIAIGVVGGQWHRLFILVVVLVLVTFVAWIGTGGRISRSQVIDQAQATSLALAFYDSSHGVGATLSNVRILSVEPGSDGRGHSVWKVNIEGSVTEAGSSIAYGSAMWLFVDAESGAVTVFAQG